MDATEDLRDTALTALHRELGARMVPFAGYAMPVQFAAGVMKEHLHTRAAAGLFDVGHMGQIVLRGPDAAAALETLVPADIVGLVEGRQRYALFTNVAGGIEDDLMVANRGDHLFLVVNAACKHADFARLRDALEPRGIAVEMLEDRALLALQGPQAEAVLTGLGAPVAGMRFMDVATVDLLGAEAWVSRSGYTGEDGFEISVPDAEAERIARSLLADDRVAPIGLGARDSLRLEAGLCLYGHDLDADTTPAAAALTRSIGKARRHDGARAGGFPGAEHVLAELSDGPATRRVGLRPEGRAPMREGTALYDAEDGGDPVGHVTSGGFGPSVGAPVAMGYVAAALARPGTPLWGDVRGRRLPVTVAALPFVDPGFKR